jgi:purine-nucleoside phosphorylase
VADGITGRIEVPFAEVPGYPRPGVAGHAGTYVAGRLGGTAVLLQSGRFHRYEGHSDDIVAAPIRVAAALGVDTLILTNAAGGIRRDLDPGAIMLLADHINWMFGSPLVGPVHGREERFPDMSHPYDEALAELARGVARELGTRLDEGVYAAVLGPAYETPAEVRVLERLGADAVGMSTVPEVLVARALGMRCLAFSVITNRAAGLGAGALGHDEVIATGREAGTRLAGLLLHLVAEIDGSTRDRRSD